MKERSKQYDPTPKQVTMRFAMEHEYPDVQFIQDASAGNLTVLTAEGDTHSHSEQEIGEGKPDCVSLGTDPSIKRRVSPTL